MKFNFFKANGLLNDFVIIPNFNFEDQKLLNDNILFLCDRKRGIGADQLLAIDKELNVLIWNQDGSIAKSCFNGFRCLGRLFFDEFGYDEKFEIKTPGGLVSVYDKDGKVGLEFQSKVEIKEVEEDVFFVNTGNLHKIYFSNEEPEKFADNIHNISCISKIISKEESGFKIRTFERGAGYTKACGSAAFAAACVLDLKKESSLNLFFEAGNINHIKNQGTLMQVASADIVYKGVISLK